MAKKNWFIEANKSDDPEIKKLLEQYNTVDANAPDAEQKKSELCDAIKEKLGLKPASEQADKQEPDTAEPESEPELGKDPEHDTDASDESDIEDKPDGEPEPEKSTKEQDTAEPEQPTFNYTEEDAATAKDLKTLDDIKKACRKEVQRLEKTRLKYGTYKQNRELDAKIWAIKRIGGIALKRDIALKERAHRQRAVSRVSAIAMKRARFVKLIRQGISITNITKHPEGVKKSELIDVLDAKTIEDCRKHYSDFPRMWERWKAKFIDNQKTNK